MATDNSQNHECMAYSASNIPVVGALVDYISTSIKYIKNRKFEADKLYVKKSQIVLPTSLLCFTCLLLGLVCNVKFEVVTNDDEPLANDLHFILMSKEDNLYIDDVDVSKVMLCIEASDTLVLMMSSLMIWRTSDSGSQRSAWWFLPWLGASLRGILLRQAPTAGALLYTMDVVNGNVNTLFMTSFSFLLILEARLWLEIARLVKSRWDRRDGIMETRIQRVETLWSKEDAPSVEVGNYVY